MIKKINNQYVKVDTRMEVIGKVVSKDVDRIVLDSDDDQVNNVGKRLVLGIRKADREKGDFLKMEVGTVYRINFSMTEDLGFDKLSVTGFINSFKEVSQQEDDGKIERSFNFSNPNYLSPMFIMDGTLKKVDNSDQLYLTSPTDDWGIMVDHELQDSDGNIIPLKEGKVHAIGKVRWYIGKSRRLGRVFKAYTLQYVDTEK